MQRGRKGLANVRLMVQIENAGNYQQKKLKLMRRAINMVALFRKPLNVSLFSSKTD
jgi:hypothetical protein